MIHLVYILISSTAIDMVANMMENQNWATFDDDQNEHWKRSELERNKNLHSDKRKQENGFESERAFVASPVVSSYTSESKEGALNVMGYDLPELEVRYRESPIKDRDVGDRVLPKDKNLTDSAECSDLVSQPEIEIADGIYDDDELGIELLDSDELELLADSAFGGGVDRNNEVNNSACGEIEEEASRDELVTFNIPSTEGPSEVKSLKALFDSRSSDSSDVDYLSDQIQHAHTIDLIRAVESPDVSPNKGMSSLSYNSKTDSGTITFDFDPLNPVSMSIEKSPNNKNKAPSPKVSSPLSINLGGEHEGQDVLGESSFSMAGPVSGIINHQDSVPNSGSLSIRSDSSTTSTRSFAFPILPNEWNSSPVRMARADKRRFRKRSWRNGLFCCFKV